MRLTCLAARDVRRDGEELDNKVGRRRVDIGWRGTDSAVRRALWFLDDVCTAWRRFEYYTRQHHELAAPTGNNSRGEWKVRGGGCNARDLGGDVGGADDSICRWNDSDDE